MQCPSRPLRCSLLWYSSPPELLGKRPKNREMSNQRAADKSTPATAGIPARRRLCARVRAGIRENFDGVLSVAISTSHSRRWCVQRPSAVYSLHNYSIPTMELFLESSEQKDSKKQFCFRTWASGWNAGICGNPECNPRVQLPGSWFAQGPAFPGRTQGGGSFLPPPPPPSSRVRNPL
ncbi:hypothetical protein L209DRAFT_129249 [Thermothelomyces heterothallicus CBS 203.75]